MTAAHEDIVTALRDPATLGAALGDPEPWAMWFVVLQAAFGLGLNRAERRAFAKVAGGRKPPARQVRELWCILGRRAGKSRVAAAIAAYIAAFIDHSDRLAAGEVGVVAVISASKDQAATVLNYVLAFFESSPTLAGMVLSTTADEVRLAGNVVIQVTSASYRTVRGRTLLACILDECGFFRDETSASPDVEVYRAVLPAMSTTNGMLIGISSPYRRVGLLGQKHRDAFGQDDPDVLVVQGASTTFNPRLDEKMIARAIAADPEAARAEWNGTFREDITSLLSDADIDRAVDDQRPMELPPEGGRTYFVFVDASASRRDAFTICVGHREGDHFIADLVRGRRPPFEPTEVARDYAALAVAYCGPGATVHGDNYGAEWVQSAFRNAGVQYKRSDLPKSGLYLEMAPRFLGGQVSIPDSPPLIRELRLLERRTSRSGRDVVDHPAHGGGSDDLANVLAGAIRCAYPRRGDELDDTGPAGAEVIIHDQLSDVEEMNLDMPDDATVDEFGAVWG